MPSSLFPDNSIVRINNFYENGYFTRYGGIECTVLPDSMNDDSSVILRDNASGNRLGFIPCIYLTLIRSDTPVFMVGSRVRVNEDSGEHSGDEAVINEITGSGGYAELTVYSETYGECNHAYPLTRLTLINPSEQVLQPVEVQIPMINPDLSKAGRTFGLEVECLIPNAKIRTVKEQLTAIQWAVGTDGSIASRSGYSPVEIRTPILSGDYGRESMRVGLDIIASNGGLADESCGGHIHIGTPEISEWDGFKRWMYNYIAIKSFANIEDDIYLYNGGDKRKNGQYAKSVRNMLDAMDGMLTASTSPQFDRYCGLNLSSYRKLKTLEFRAFIGSVDIKRWSINLDLAMAFTERVVNCETVNALSELSIDLSCLPIMRTLYRNPEITSQLRTMAKQFRRERSLRDIEAYKDVYKVWKSLRTDKNDNNADHPAYKMLVEIRKIFSQSEMFIVEKMMSNRNRYLFQLPGGVVAAIEVRPGRIQVTHGDYDNVLYK